MRMMRRAGLLGDIHYPTLAELFASRTASAANFRSSSSADVITAGLSSSAAAGDDWYYFYLCGGSLEISKVHVDSLSSITRTTLSSTNASGQTKRQTTVSGTNLVTESIYAGAIVKMKFAYTASIVDYCLSQCYKSYFGSYYSSSTTYDTGVRVASSSLSGRMGVIFTAYRNALTNAIDVWGVSEVTSPTTPVLCSIGGTLYDDRAVWKLDSGYLYPVPSASSSVTSMLLRSYAMVNLYEDW